ncbi:MAG: SlyX family protein [Hydrogenovibrio sp.]|nr:SlyX family protein [Hydrogenovibrio sp.]
MAEQLTASKSASEQLEEKVHQLEMQLAYQDETLEAMNMAMGKQHQEIQQLQHQLKLLTEYLKSLKSDVGSHIKLPSEETPPPHY